MNGLITTGRLTLRTRGISILLLVAAGIRSANAEVAEISGEGGEDPWSGRIALGFLGTSGNTRSSRLTSGFLVRYAADTQSHSLEAKGTRSTRDHRVTAEDYVLGWKTEINITRRNFLFTRINWRKDRFSGYDRQISETIGYGRRTTDTGPHFFGAEIGAGMRQAKRSDGTSEEGFIVRAGFSYRWQLKDTVQFKQSLSIESGPANTFCESISAMKTSLVGTLALVASYTVKNNSQVPVSNENTDTITALSLEYGF